MLADRVGSAIAAKLRTMLATAVAAGRGLPLQAGVCAAAGQDAELDGDMIQQFLASNGSQGYSRRI
jgi:hypothetical protein